MRLDVVPTLSGGPGKLHRHPPAEQTWEGGVPLRRATCWTIRLTMWGTLLGSVLAQQGAPLSHQIAAMAGHGLTSVQCQERLQALDTLLRQGGYGTARTHTLMDGVLASRWYNTQTDRTVVAFAGQRAEGNAFTTAELAGPIRWNEFMATP